MLLEVGDTYTVFQKNENEEKYMLELNSYAAYLWKMFSGRNVDIQSAKEEYLSYFNLQYSVADSDVNDFVAFCLENNIIGEN